MKKLIVCCIVLLVCLLALPAGAVVVVYKVTADATVLAADVNGAEPNAIKNINLKGVGVADVNIADVNNPLITDSTIIWYDSKHKHPDSNAFATQFGSVTDVNTFVIGTGKAKYREIVLEIGDIGGDNEVIVMGKLPKHRAGESKVAKILPSAFKGAWSLDEADLVFLTNDLKDAILHGSGNVTLTLDAKQTKIYDANDFDSTVTDIITKLRTKLHIE